MDAVELPLPTAVVTKLMRSSGGGGGGGTTVEMVTSQLESATSSSSSFHPPKEKIRAAKQKTISVERSEKRNARISKRKCDSFCIKVGLSSFSSAAGGTKIFGGYSLKHGIYDVAKHLDEVSLNELLDDTYKRPQNHKDKQKNMKILNENILQSVKDACSVLQLRKSSQLQNLATAGVTYHQNASSCLPNCDTFGACKSDDYSSSSNKVKDSCSSFIVQPCYMVEVPLLSPKDVLNQLTPSLHKELDLLHLEIMKPSLMSRSNLGRSGLPSFPWSHISGGHFRTNPDLVKLTTLSKSTCQGRWVKIGNSTLSFGDTTNFLADLGSLAYDQSIVPLRDSNNTRDGCAPGVLAAAQTLCEIATLFHKQDQSVTIRWPKKRPFTSILSKKPNKLRKLAPMECRSLPNKNRYAC